MKKILALVAIFLLSVSCVYADIEITGKVTIKETGQVIKAEKGEVITVKEIKDQISKQE